MRSADKALRFPLGGIAKNLSYRDTTYPSEESVYSTPMAVNVVGECAFSSRLRGGSRPGLKAFTGTQPSQDAQEKWLWPNGEEILWNSTTDMVYNVNLMPVTPDGVRIVNQHEAFNVAATKGAIPQNLTCFTMYRDRLVVAKDAMWYASRTSDHGDFDYGGEAGDVTRAVAGSISLAGAQGENITALIPIADQRLYIATARRIAVVSEEPTSGITTLSEFVGVISRDAWCNAGGVVYFMGDKGLYAIGDGAPMLVSQQIPEDIKGLASALLIYDPDRSGIHIFTGTGVSAADYFYDIGNKAFWPISYSSSVRPVLGGTAIVEGVNRVIFKCADDYWRYWDDSAYTDGGTSFNSKIAIGPFKCGTRDDVDGMLDKLTVTLGRGSSSVTICGYSGNSAEAAFYAAENSNDVDFSFVAGEGWNSNVHVRCRGAWCVIVLNSLGKWAYESIMARTKVLGGLR